MSTQKEEIKTTPLDGHAELAARVVALRKMRSEIAADLKRAEADLTALIGDAEVATLGGETLFIRSCGPDKEAVDYEALVAALSPRTVAKYRFMKPGQWSLRMGPNPSAVVERFLNR